MPTRAATARGMTADFGAPAPTLRSLSRPALGDRGRQRGRHILRAFALPLGEPKVRLPEDGKLPLPGRVARRRGYPGTGELQTPVATPIRGWHCANAAHVDGFILG